MDYGSLYELFEPS